MAAIVVFDGECGLCNGFVAWLIQHDPHARFLLAGSNGKVGRAVIAAAGLPPQVAESTLIVWDGTRARLMSDAVLAVAAGLPWPWRIGAAGRIVPRRLRNLIYRSVARRRSRVTAEDPACGVPPRELVDRWRSRLASLADVSHTAAPRS